MTNNFKIDGSGKRFNQGKPRYDLIPTFAQEQYAKVLTKGAEKYGSHNWRQGMKWSNVLASLERHLEAVKKGEDYDEETGLLHSAHIMCNAGFLTEYYKIYPQGDDRNHSYLFYPKIGLDIDEVLADFIKHYSEKYNDNIIPESWNFDKRMPEILDKLKEDKEFWLSIPVKTKPSDIPFEPTCYITSRNIPTEWTEEWIKKNGFPTVPVYTVGLEQSKLEVAKEAGIDIMVDDRMRNFVEFNNNGICCYLFDAKHNQRYKVGYKRIKSLKELF